VIHLNPRDLDAYEGEDEEEQFEVEQDIPETDVAEVECKEPEYHREADPDVLPIDDLAISEAKKITSELLRLMCLPAVVEANAREAHVYVNITGRDGALIIGRKGETLNAIQYMINRLLHKNMGGVVRVVVDTERYRGRRAKSLKDFALRNARKVSSSGKDMVLETMTPADRRIIHMSLQHNRSVTTHSRGEGANRRVVISPRPQAQDGKR
jgi:spoIIIJ-associated protein